MLVLSRWADQSIVIDGSDGPIEVMVVRIRSDGRVQLGITAPKNVAVHRKEIHERIQREKQK